MNQVFNRKSKLGRLPTNSLQNKYLRYTPRSYISYKYLIQYTILTDQNNSILMGAAQCFMNNPCVKEEKSYSLPDCVEEDETGAVVFLLKPDVGVPLVEALCPIE